MWFDKAITKLQNYLPKRKGAKPYFITMQPRSIAKQSTLDRWQKSCGPASDFIRRFSDCYIIVRELNKRGCAHYHIVAWITNKNINKIQNCKTKICVHIERVSVSRKPMFYPDVRDLDPNEWYEAVTVPDDNNYKIYMFTLQHIINQNKKYRKLLMADMRVYRDNSLLGAGYWRSLFSILHYMLKDYHDDYYEPIHYMMK